jgi:hypothetical protein
MRWALSAPNSSKHEAFAVDDSSLMNEPWTRAVAPRAHFLFAQCCRSHAESNNNGLIGDVIWTN